MSDLYNEAARHDYIRVPKYLAFLGGGLVAVLLVAMGPWMTVTTEEAVVDPPGVRERFAMKWGDRFLTLVATEDEFGGSLGVLFFSRGDT